MAVTYERQETSKKRLQLRWKHPVPVGEEVLDFETALKEIRGDDARPMIILRDCDFCKGKDHALLDRKMSNEKTLLFVQWFHCVKLDRRVVEPSHPWSALFAGEKKPHVLMVSWDGKTAIPLDGQQKQKKTWANLRKILKGDYRKDANIAVKNWLRMLDKFDQIDSRKKEVERQIDELESKGKKRRVAKLKKELQKIAADKRGALAQEQKIIDLILKHAPKAKTIDDFDAEAAAEVRAKGGGLLDKIRKDNKR